MLWTGLSTKLFQVLISANPSCTHLDVPFIQGNRGTWFRIANPTPSSPLLSSTVHSSAQALHLAPSGEVLGIAALNCMCLNPFLVLKKSDWALYSPMLQFPFTRKKLQKLQQDLDYKAEKPEKSCDSAACINEYKMHVGSEQRKLLLTPVQNVFQRVFKRILPWRLMLKVKWVGVGWKDNLWVLSEMESFSWGKNCGMPGQS